MFEGKAFRGGKYDGTTAHSSNVFIPLRASSARLRSMPTLRVARFPRLPFFTTPSQSTRRRVVTGNFQREAKTFIVVNIIFSSLCHLADSCETTSKAPLSELLCNRRNGRKTKKHSADSIEELWRRRRKKTAPRRNMRTLSSSKHQLPMVINDSRRLSLVLLHILSKQK